MRIKIQFLKPRLLFLLLTMITMTCAGQTIRSVSTIFPSEITTADSVFYYFVVLTPGSSCFLTNYDLSFTNDSFHLKTCVQDGSLGQPCGVEDSLFLGNSLAVGKYHLIHYSSISSLLVPEDSMCLMQINNPDAHDTAYYSFTVLSPTATHELNSLGEIHLLPNPAGNRLQFSFGTLPKMPLSAKVFDLHGRQLLQQSLSAIQEPELGVGGLLPGLYLLQVQDAQGRTGVLKFVKR